MSVWKFYLGPTLVVVGVALLAYYLTAWETGPLVYSFAVAGSSDTQPSGWYHYYKLPARIGITSGAALLSMGLVLMRKVRVWPR